MGDLPDTITVVGGGRMGAGIAHAFAAAGSLVTVVETVDAEAARARLRKSPDQAERRGLLPDPLVAVLDRVTFVDALSSRIANARLVVEAVPEDIALKQSVVAVASYRDYRDRYRDMAKTLGYEGHIAWAEAMP